MKTCEEKTRSVLSRIEAEKEAQRKQRKAVTRVAVPVLSCCIVAVLGIGAWQAGILQRPSEVSEPAASMAPIPNPDGTIQLEKIPDDIPAQPILRPGDEGYITPEPTPAPDSGEPVLPTDPEMTDSGTHSLLPADPTESAGAEAKPSPGQIGELVHDPKVGDVDGVCVNANFSLSQWKGKTVLTGLVEALEKAPADEIFEIYAHPYIDYDFVCDGRTLAAYYSDMCDERNLPEILTQLLKEGDELKYGAALYEVGTNDGIKWDKRLYESRMSFYGPAMLEKYIVNGEFLRDLVQADLENAKNAKDATKAYKAAFAVYYQHLIDTLQITLPADVKGDGIVLPMTAEEFGAFMPEHVEAWTFSRLD